MNLNVVFGFLPEGCVTIRVIQVLLLMEPGVQMQIHLKLNDWNFSVCKRESAIFPLWRPVLTDGFRVEEEDLRFSRAMKFGMMRFYERTPWWTRINPDWKQINGMCRSCVFYAPADVASSAQTHLHLRSCPFCSTFAITFWSEAVWRALDGSVLLHSIKIRARAPSIHKMLLLWI